MSIAVNLCQEKKKSIWNKVCKGDILPCLFCGQEVCRFHGLGNPRGIRGGHTDCSTSCNSSNSLLCQGYMSQYEVCKKPYCEYHSQQCGRGRLVVGHVCEGHCEISPQFRNNCQEITCPCSHCPYKYCKYHHKANGHALELEGGHVCSGVTAGAALASTINNAAYYTAGAAAMTTIAVATGGHGMLLLGAAAGGALSGGSFKQALNEAAECHTGRQTAGMCDGSLETCPYCHNKYCTYHFPASEDLTHVVGGHCCKEHTGRAEVGIAVGHGIAAGTYVLETVTAGTGAASSATSLVSTSGAVAAYHAGKGTLDAYSAGKAAVALTEATTK